jgi:hypothetical protein
VYSRLLLHRNRQYDNVRLTSHIKTAYQRHQQRSSETNDDARYPSRMDMGMEKEMEKKSRTNRTNRMKQ